MSESTETNSFIWFTVHKNEVGWNKLDELELTLLTWPSRALLPRQTTWLAYSVSAAVPVKGQS